MCMYNVMYDVYGIQRVVGPLRLDSCLTLVGLAKEALNSGRKSHFDMKTGLFQIKDCLTGMLPSRQAPLSSAKTDVLFSNSLLLLLLLFQLYVVLVVPLVHLDWSETNCQSPALRIPTSIGRPLSGAECDDLSCDSSSFPCATAPLYAR
jgi:hypothetical protein